MKFKFAIIVCAILLPTISFADGKNVGKCTQVQINQCTLRGQSICEKYCIGPDAGRRGECNATASSKCYGNCSVVFPPSCF